MFHIKTSMLQSIQSLSVYFCTNFIHFPPSSFIVYCHITIHSIPIRPGWISHLPLSSILKPSRYSTFSYSKSQYPITLHIILSSCNTFRSKLSQSDSSSPFMIQSKTFMLQSIHLLSFQSDTLLPITLHRVLSSCDPFCFKPSQLDLLSSVIFHSILFH